MHASLNARCSVLAAAGSSVGRVGFDSDDEDDYDTEEEVMVRMVVVLPGMQWE